MVNLELYKVFYTVAKCGSLTKAAEELYISQPAVSQAIRQLENSLGGKLFNRTHKGMELTENGGKQVFEMVKEALSLLDKAEKTFTEYKDTATGVLRICASDTVSTHFLLPYIKEYHEKYPEVKIVLINGTTGETLEQLKGGKGDVGLVNLPVEYDGVEVINTVMTIHDTFVGGEKYKDLANGITPLKALEDYPLLMLETPTVSVKSVNEFASFHGIKLNPEIEPSSIELMVSLALSGMGIACVPREFVKKEIESGILLEIKTSPSLPSRAIGLAINRSGNLTFAVKEFIKLIGGSC